MNFFFEKRSNRTKQYTVSMNFCRKKMGDFRLTKLRNTFARFRLELFFSNQSKLPAFFLLTLDYL